MGMAFRSVGVNHTGNISTHWDLEPAKSAGADFVEIWLEDLGVILGGVLDETRLEPLRELLLDADLGYTVHAPLEVNLMDLTAPEIQRSILMSSVRFAGEIGAGTVVCHAGQRLAARDARFRLKDQLAAERESLGEIGDLAEALGVTVAVENFYPDRPVLGGAAYDYSVWPSELAEQIDAVDHPAVGVCLDVGHAALAAGAFGFDLFEECAAVAPLVRHIHLHDNLGKTDPGIDPASYGDRIFGTGDLHLPPGVGTIPLEGLFGRLDFPADPACCVELAPALSFRAPEALKSARHLGRLTPRQKIAS